jgi:Sec-independent protein translocase protein TatA
MSGGWESPVFIAFIEGPVVWVLVAGAVLLFGSGKIRELARGLGGAKKEFMAGQAEAEVEMERAKARARADAEASANVAAAGVASGQTPASPMPPPVPPTPPASAS